MSSTKSSFVREFTRYDLNGFAGFSHFMPMPCDKCGEECRYTVDKKKRKITFHHPKVNHTSKFIMDYDRDPSLKDAPYKPY